MISVLALIALGTAAAPTPIVSSGDKMVDARLATLGRITKGDENALLRVVPSNNNVRAPANAKGRRLSCPSVSGSYSFSAGGKHVTSGRYSVSGSCMWLP
jgi:hypothetical protein